MAISFPGESDAYRAARNELLELETELRRATESVVAARRRLPPGGVIPQDYTFQGRGADGTITDVRLSELFAPGRDRGGEQIRHFWGSELLYAPTDLGQDLRHVGALEPLWNLFDHTREGRPADWHEQLSYAPIPLTQQPQGGLS